MVKLVITDLDGTLLSPAAKLIPEVLALVEKLREHGIHFSVATGRVRSKTEEYIVRMGLQQVPYICCNGAAIICSGEPVVNHQIPVAGLRELITKAQAMGMSIIYSIDGIEYTTRKTPWVLHDEEKSGYLYGERPLSENDWKNLWVDKFTIMDDVRDGRIAEIESMGGALSDQYFFTRYLDRAIEIVDKGSTKGNALKQLTELLGVSLEETLAIGDHQNDWEMVEMAGIGSAVANATQALKQRADYVATQSNGLGVVETVKHFVFEQNGVIL